MHIDNDVSSKSFTRERFGPSRLRVNRITGRFADKRVEALFGSYAYRDRVHALRSGSLLFAFFVFAYIVFAILSKGLTYVLAVRFGQLFGLLLVSWFAWREYILLRRSANVVLISGNAMEMTGQTIEMNAQSKREASDANRLDVDLSRHTNGSCGESNEFMTDVAREAKRIDGEAKGIDGEASEIAKSGSVQDVEIEIMSQHAESKSDFAMNQSVVDEAGRRAWARAASEKASRVVEAASLFCVAWGWITLMVIRTLEDVWHDMPVSLIFFAWGAPVIARTPFLQTVSIHCIGLLIFLIFTSLQNPTGLAVIQILGLSAATFSGIFLAYTSNIYRRSQLRAILWYYNATPQGTDIHEFMKQEYTRLKANLRATVKYFRFKNPAWEMQYINFFHNRSIFFVRATVVALLIINSLLYIPDSRLNSSEQTFAFTVRTYASFPLWAACLGLLMPGRLAPYRPWIVATAAVVATGFEFVVMAQMESSEDVAVYFVTMWRIIDVVCTSFCLPFRIVALVVVATLLGTLAMLAVGCRYFFNLLNMTLFWSALATGLYISSVAEADSRMAFVQFAHRIRPSRSAPGFYAFVDLPFSRPSMLATIPTTLAPSTSTTASDIPALDLDLHLDLPSSPDPDLDLDLGPNTEPTTEVPRA